ncbi:MAG: protein-L-isoaspartate(D-aspartate) O-methyltransferase [Ignavibacteriaceae bacterium]
MKKVYERERKELVDKLSMKGINDIYVLKAIGEVERHLFVSQAMLQHAYKDVALPIGFEQTISQPYTVAFMTEQLKLNPGNKVLEIGTGSGYQAAILDKMGMQVFSIERNLELYIKTRLLLDKLGIRAHTKYGDGTIGWVEYAPYDGIIVTAGSPSVPASLKKQLAPGGRLVIPVGDKSSQTLKVITKTSDDEFEITNIPEFQFVPLIGREGWSQK